MQNTKIQLHFIIGIGRSGTTILTKMLNVYKDVHCMPEANFLGFFLQKFAHKKAFSQNDINQLFAEIELYSYSHPWVGWNFNIELVKKESLEFVASKPLVTFSELSCFIYQHFYVEGIDKGAAKMLIDKNPSFTIFVEEISQVLPESKFIWIVRDYRANILSRKQSVFLKSPNIAYNAVRWKLYNRIAYKYYKKNRDKIILVKYEELVSEPSKFEEILKFLAIEPIKESNEELQAINLNEFKIEEKYQDRFFKKYSDLNKKLNSDRIHSWKEQLSAKEIEICDAICYDIPKEIGYKTNTNISILKKIQIVITHLLPISLGYLDIVKDKILFYFPIQFKLNRLKKKYIELGFIKK